MQGATVTGRLPTASAVLAVAIGCGSPPHEPEVGGSTGASTSTTGGDEGGSGETPCWGWCTSGGVDIPGADTDACPLDYPAVEWLWERWHDDVDDTVDRRGLAIAFDDAGGMVVAGHRSYWFPEAVWIARLDAEGTAVWEHVHELDVHTVDIARAGTSTTLAATTSGGGGYVASLWTYADDGLLLWEGVEDGDESEPLWWVSDVVPTPDGGIVLAARHDWPPTPWLAAYDPSGIVLWSGDVARLGEASLNDITVTADGRLLASSGATLLARSASDGSPMWSTTIEHEGLGGAFAGALAVRPDGSTLAAGVGIDASGPGLALRLFDVDGALSWTRLHLDLAVGVAIAEPSGSTIVLGTTSGCYGSPQWIAEIKIDGEIAWGRTIQGETVHAIARNTNGRIVVTGSNGSWGDGAWIAELDRPRGGG